MESECTEGENENLGEEGDNVSHVETEKSVKMMWDIQKFREQFIRSIILDSEDKASLLHFIINPWLSNNELPGSLSREILGSNGSEERMVNILQEQIKTPGNAEKVDNFFEEFFPSEYLERAREFIQDSSTTYSHSRVKRVVKSSDKVDTLVHYFFKQKWPKRLKVIRLAHSIGRRKEEKKVLEEFSGELETTHVKICGIYIPIDVFLIVLDFLPRNRSLISGIGCASERLLCLVLSNWKRLVIGRKLKDILSISLLVLGSVEELTIRRQLKQLEIEHLFKNINPEQLKVLDMSEVFNSERGNCMILSIPSLPHLQVLRFPERIPSSVVLPCYRIQTKACSCEKPMFPRLQTLTCFSFFQFHKHVHTAFLSTLEVTLRPFDMKPEGIFYAPKQWPIFTDTASELEKSLENLSLHNVYTLGIDMRFSAFRKGRMFDRSVGFSTEECPSLMNLCKLLISKCLNCRNLKICYNRVEYSQVDDLSRDELWKDLELDLHQNGQYLKKLENLHVVQETYSTAINNQPRWRDLDLVNDFVRNLDDFQVLVKFPRSLSRLELSLYDLDFFSIAKYPCEFKEVDSLILHLKHVIVERNQYYINSASSFSTYDGLDDFLDLLQTGRVFSGIKNLSIDLEVCIRQSRHVNYYYQHNFDIDPPWVDYEVYPFLLFEKGSFAQHLKKDGLVVTSDLAGTRFRRLFLVQEKLVQGFLERSKWKEMKRIHWKGLMIMRLVERILEDKASWEGSKIFKLKGKTRAKYPHQYLMEF